MSGDLKIESRSLTEIFIEDFGWIVATVFGLFCGLWAVIYGSALAHIYVIEVPLMAEIEADRGYPITEINPAWAYLLSTVFYLMMVLLCAYLIAQLRPRSKGVWR